MLVVSFMWIVAQSASGSIILEGFTDFMDPSTFAQTLRNDVNGQTCDSLMWKNPQTEFAEIVPKIGIWRLAAVMYNGAEAYVVGYANNDNGYSNNNAGWEGWLKGEYASPLGDGNRPDDVWIVWDVNGDGIGSYQYGTWTLGPDDLFYGSQDLLFGPERIRGDISQMPVFSSPNGGVSAILPQMVVDPIPEPATIVLLGLGGLAPWRRRKP